jgi:hypothetical protein
MYVEVARTLASEVKRLSIEPVRNQDQVYRTQISSEQHNVELSKKNADERYSSVQVVDELIEKNESSVLELEKKEELNPDSHHQHHNKKEQPSQKNNQQTAIIEPPKRIFSPKGGDFLDVIV